MNSGHPRVAPPSTLSTRVRFMPGPLRLLKAFEVPQSHFSGVDAYLLSSS